jgi:hypothetical protein
MTSIDLFSLFWLLFLRIFLYLFLVFFFLTFLVWCPHPPDERQTTWGGRR